ncbi:13404_t:CDS:2, partial [Gigaspora margarita]
HANNNKHEISNSLYNDNQQFESNNYQLDANKQSYDEKSGYEFEDNMNYSNQESIYKYEFSKNINSNSLNDEYKQISIDINNAPKTLDRIKSDINWDYKCPFSFFENFTNMAIFIWATKYMISPIYILGGYFSNLCEELWERDFWAESPLFNLPNIITSQD